MRATRRGKWPAGVGGAALLVFLALAFIRRDYTSHSNGGISSITLPARWISVVLLGSATLAAVTCVVCAVVLGLKRRKMACAVLLFTGLVGFSVALIKNIVSNLAPWTVEATLVVPESQTYAFLDSSFLQGQRMALGRQSHQNLLWTNYDVCGTTNGDDPLSWASVVRPSGAPSDDYGQLYLAPSDVIVGIRTDHKCFFAYDLATERFIGRKDIENLSPFVLISEHTELNQLDIEGILHELRSRGRDQPGRPRDIQLRAGLTHVNPRVRDIAKRMLQAG